MTAQGDDALRAFETLAQHAHLGELISRTERVARGMASARRLAFGDAGLEMAAFVADDAAESKRGVESRPPQAADLRDGKTPWGDAQAVLARGPQDDGERALASALYAHAFAASWAAPEATDAKAQRRMVAELLWLATHTPFDAIPLIDRALGERAPALWTAIADAIRACETGSSSEIGRGEALIGCIALVSSSSEIAQGLAQSLEDELHDPALLHVLSVLPSDTLSDAVPQRHLQGELVPAPRGWVATTALALSGILFVFHGARLLARLALAYRCPAEVTLSADGVRVDSRVEMLGRTLREKSTVIGRDALVRAVRDVRYPRVGFYAGLLSLAIGTYFGVSTAVDGVRAASPSLLLVGLVCIAAGIGLDFFFSSIAPGAKGRCRVVFVPARGPALCIGYVDIHAANGALETIAART